MNRAMDRTEQYVSFLLAGDEYAVDILRAREIVEYSVLTRVPMSPAAVRGVLNLRGRVIPVIDLAKRLGLPPAEPTRTTCILMVDATVSGEPSVIGLMIDAVSEVRSLSPTDIEPPPPFGAKVRLDCVAGMGKVGNTIVMLLDIDRVVSLDDVYVASAPALEAPRAEEASRT